MNIINTLNGYINCLSEISECTKTINSSIHYIFTECLEALTNSNHNFDETYLFKINVVLDYLHDELNTGHWSNVPITIRQIFTASSFMKALIILKTNQDNKNALSQSLKCVDLGILLGAPLEKNSELLTKTASYLTQQLNKFNFEAVNLNKKRKLSRTEFHSKYNEIPGKEINILSCPSVELFNKNYFIPQIPVKLTDCIDHWPAMTKWLDVNYLLSVAGNRTVPIEIGSHYADENWSQKLMILKDFIKNYFLSEHGSNNLGYLAQHNLFDQITELRNDIFIPDYCCLSKNYDESTEPEINAWLGPANTVSPLHYDPKNNFFTQIFGTKQIILFSPEDSEFLYPHPDILLNNTAQVNPLNVDYKKFPMFKSAVMFKCLLSPGEMLFIPEKWWHHVSALEKSFSVSFWWK